MAQAVAHELGFHYLDSGALYRLVALQALRAGWTAETALDVAHEQQLAEWASALDALFGRNHYVGGRGCEPSHSAGSDRQYGLENRDGRGFAPSVLLQRQRDFAQEPGLVADGRDMASVVFPDALAKKSFDRRCTFVPERRYKQLIDKGFSANMTNLVADLQARDARDMARAFAPLKPVAGAYVLDTSHMSWRKRFRR